MKVALIADAHLGVKKSDKIFQDSQIRFFAEQLVPELKERNITTIIFLGDVIDTRQSVNTNTMNVVLKLFNEILKDFEVHIIVGNHDLYYTTTTEVNSIKWLSLVKNVHLYEVPTKVVLGKPGDEKEVLMLPWITNYDDFENWNISAEYVFAHLDIAGMRMDKFTYCTGGATIQKLLDRFEHTYTGHFHTRSELVNENRNITYVGSPYQITRIDKDDSRGYTILDLNTNETEFVENTKSMKFKEIVFPTEIENKESFAKGNIVDVLVKYDDSKYSKKIYEYAKSFEQFGTAYPVNVKILQKEAEQQNTKNLESINIFSLMKEYIDAEEEIPKDEKTRVYTELINLYNSCVKDA